MRSPSCPTSSSGPSAAFRLAEYSRSAVDSSVCTAAASFSSAGPAASCSGRIKSGSIGSVELGVRCGSHVAAGRSYHGVAASPWEAGIVYGMSFAILGSELSDVEVSAASPLVAMLLPRLAMASRSFDIVAGGKCCFSCQMSTSVCSFATCLGHLSNAAADATSAGIVTSQAVARPPPPFASAW